jgi:probable addiction module antidote protein
MEKIAEWDPAEYINTKDDIIAFLVCALEDNDTEYLFKTLEYVSRSKGMTKIAHELGVTREGLYKSLSPDGNPSFNMVIKLLDILGYKLTVKEKEIA